MRVICQNCGKTVPFTGTVCPWCNADKSTAKTVKVCALICGLLLAIVFGFTFGGLLAPFVGGALGGVLGSAVGIVLEQRIPRHPRR